VTSKLAIALRQLEACFLFVNSAVTFRSRSAKHVQVERVIVNALEMRLCV